jgi:hypothetical protein
LERFFRHGLPWLAAVSGYLGMAAAAAEESPRPVTKVVRVFLADFEDGPHPAAYTREYFQDLFFGLGTPRQTPEGKPLEGSVREYFVNVSDGWLDVGGEVADWVRIPRKITEIPHWKSGMEPFGESWPVIIAETLRANGIVGDQARARLQLPEERMPDGLVFLNTDWGVGGVRREWGHLKDVLHQMHLDDLWDESWAGLGMPLGSFSATIWRGAPASRPDGTLPAVPPPEALEFFPLSIMMHEMGHLIADLPDLYGGAYEPWGVFDLMGGPAASTHYPMSLSAYLREARGWMRYTDLPRRTQRALTLWPLETHKQAFRLPQGLEATDEALVVENRWRLEYPGHYSDPPADRGARLLVYRVDPAGRRRQNYGASAERKVTTMVRRPEHYGEVWGEGEFTEITIGTQPTSRNSRGELWWELRDVHPAADGAMRFDAEYRAVDLGEIFHQAAWRNGHDVILTPGEFHGPAGHARRRGLAVIGGQAVRDVLHLQPEQTPGGQLRGVWRLPPAGPQRLYLRLALPEGMDAPATVAVQSGRDTPAPSTSLDAAHRQQTLVADLWRFDGTLTLTLTAGPADGHAEAYVQDAWLVSLPPVVQDLLALETDWSVEPSDTSAVGRAESVVLADGWTYGPGVVSLPLKGGPSSWRGTSRPWSVPEAGGVLRGLVGFTAGASAGAAFRVAVRLTNGAQTWTLVENLDVSSSAPEEATRDPWQTLHPAVIESPLPPETQGQTVTATVEVTWRSGEAATVAWPMLAVCGG